MRKSKAFIFLFIYNNMKVNKIFNVPKKLDLDILI